MSGTTTDSTQECSSTLPQFSESGTWGIALLFLSDAVGNNRTLGAADLIAKGFDIEFVNTSQGDTTAPDVVELTIDTPTVDTTNGSDTVRFTVRVVDDLSGFDGSDVSFTLQKPARRTPGGPE